MPKLVVHGATLQCSMGSSPAKLTVAPTNATFGGEAPAATIQDMQPMANVAAFGMCKAPSNPQVAAATSAAGGVLTPQPCVPVIGAPWSPGSKSVTLSEQPALGDRCTCACTWGGQIQVEDAGQTVTEVD